MCPRGDDPLTDNMKNMVITLNIVSSLANGLSGTLRIDFLGNPIYLPLASPTNAACSLALNESLQIGSVNCTYSTITSDTQRLVLTFTDWPDISTGNNFYANDGSPSASDFYCDVSQANAGVTCSFVDTVQSDIAGG